jgi:hypothetical protein
MKKLIIAFMVFLTLNTNAQNTSAYHALKVGDTVPDFSMKIYETSTGKTYTKTLYQFLGLDSVEVSDTTPKKRLVADETWFVKSGDLRFRILTSNDNISDDILAKFGNGTIIKYQKIWQPQRKYWECSYYFDNIDENKVLQWIHTKYGPSL